MQTQFAPWAQELDFRSDAEENIRRCTHCGFCLSACPTYQTLGDELDSPRGRIYQIKRMLEGETPSEDTLTHLDRCLTCHACETVCPSGVEYGKLIDIGRSVIAERVPRSFKERTLRSSLRVLTQSPLFAPLYRMGQLVRPLLPGSMKDKVAARRPAGEIPETSQHQRQVALLSNCVQPAMLPSIDAATRRVLDALQVGTRYISGSGCCGAINFHLNAQEKGREQMRANIDAWLPLLQSGEIEAIVINASGCGGMIRQYPFHLKYDPVYGAKAEELMQYVQDIGEFLAPMAAELRRLIQVPARRLVFHSPCTLEHWQRARTTTEKLLRDLGFDMQAYNEYESHLCCGSAGTYSITQPELSRTLRDRKLDALQKVRPDAIVTANIGCACQLQSGTQTPVRHWIEQVDACLHALPAR